MIFAAALLAAAVIAPVNVFSIANGGVVVSTTGDYSMGWSSIQLIDGDARTGWCAPEHKKAGTIVIELAQPYRLRAIALDNAAAQESGYGGISARNVEIWTSSVSATAGFTKITAIEVPKGARREAALSSPVVARWVKVVVLSNWGNADWTELAEVEGFGEPAGPRPQPPNVRGAYDTNDGRVQFLAATPQLTGCYDGGSISGVTDGRTMEVEWRSHSNKDRFGAAQFSLSSDGQILNGVWYLRGQKQGMWSGRRIAKAPECPPQPSDLASKMKASGRAIAYGIRFDSDSAKLTSDSVATLEQIESLLKKDRALRLTVEGHTDSTNTDAYNLELSKKRAEAVVAWLTAKSIGAARLQAVGFGRTKPVADNSTPQGRALNRRVEIAAQ